MAWIEQTGQHNWRVRYPKPTGGYGSVSGFTTAKAARDYAEDLESDRRHGRWLDPDGAKTTVAAWADRWVDTLDVETRTEENYRAYLRNHILPRWRRAALGEITALAVTAWIKMLREDYATSTVAGIVTVFSMLLDDAVDERLIPANPVHRRRRRGRRRDHSPTRVERVWAMPDHVLRIADQARTLGGPSASLLDVTRFDHWVRVWVRAPRRLGFGRSRVAWLGPCEQRSAVRPYQWRRAQAETTAASMST